MLRKLLRYSPLLVLALLALVSACSNKKNTAGSRFWQAFNTRYNVYYNGKTHYDEQYKEMMDAYEDDYSQHLFVHPAEARNYPKAPQPGGNFDRTIEKMQKAIALHSIKKKPNKKSGKGNDPKYKEWMSRGEYNPFIHNAWVTLAKAQYMKGDFLNAAATFRYVERTFDWKPDLVNEAKVWQALSYCAMGWTTEAENVLSHVHIDKIDDKHTRALANLAFADYYVKEHRGEQAIPYLAQAVDGFGGGEKVRLNFLLGQLYEEAGQKDQAYLAYKAAGGYSGSTYRTKVNARIKQSAVYSGSEIAKEVRSLKAMTHYDRNKEYLDQIYYAIGNLYLAHGDTTRAIENYILAAEKSTRNGIDKAISQLTLGGVYFARRQYDKAQPCYAEAIPQLSEDYPNYKTLKKRSDVLDELSVYSGNVTLQDSLLKLSRMTPEEQKAVIAKIIEELKKKEKEEAEAAKREEYLAQQAAKGNQTGNTNASQPTNYQLNTDNSWYFYNTATKNAGKTAFQQQWGNRKLEDDWRRRNKQTFSLGDEDTEETGDSLMVNANGDTVAVDKESLKRAEDPHYEEYYLKQIPVTPEQQQAAHDVIQEGLYNMGIILKDKLEDYNAAAYEFGELERRYPDNIYRLDVYYNLYLMYMRNNQRDEAEVYRDSILTDFADSKYGMAMQDPDYLQNLKNMQVDQERMYEQAYANYLANNNEAVHEAYAEMMRKYPLSKIMPKFMFIDALSYVTQKNTEKFRETLTDMLKRYPQTDLTTTASDMVRKLNSGRRLESGAGNARGMLWTTRLGNDTTPQDINKKFTPFKEDDGKPQVFILLYPTDSVSSNQLLYEVARHNFNSFKVKDYDLEQMTFGRLGLLVVKNLSNFDEAKHYRTTFEQDQTINIPAQVHYVIISVDNFNLLINEGRSFEDYFNYLEEKNDREHAAIEHGTAAPDGKAAASADKNSKSARRNKRAAQQDQQSQQDRSKVEDMTRRRAEQVAAQQRAEEQARQQALQDSLAIVAQQQADKEAEARRLAAEQERAQQDSVARATRQQRIRPDDYQQSVNSQPVKPDLANQRDEDEHLKQLEREAKQRERAQRQREKEVQDSIRAEEKAQEKLRQIAEQARIDSIESAMQEAAKSRQDYYKWREDSARQAQKDLEQARKDSKKERERLRKEREKERKQQIKEKQRERKEKAKAREQERKEREKERKEKAKQRERERKEKAKQREQERKGQAEERKRQRETERQQSQEQKKQQAQQQQQQQAQQQQQQSQQQSQPADKGNDSGASRSVRDRKGS